jgi:hypothetical protein
MHCRLITIFLVTTVIATPVRAQSAGQIIATSEPAAAEIAPLPVGRRLIALPALEFLFIIEPRCESDMRVESVSISVADTRKTLQIDEINDSLILETRIAIPRRQASPLAVADFCVTTELANQSPNALLVQDAFTAHLSMRCANEERQSIVYSTEGLDLLLSCKSEIQEPSPESTAK